MGIGEKAEQIHIVPASYQIQEALELPGTKILMKAGKKMPVIKDMLRESGEWFAMVETAEWRENGSMRIQTMFRTIPVIIL